MKSIKYIVWPCLSSYPKQFLAVFLSFLLTSPQSLLAGDVVRISGSTGTSVTLIWMADKMGAFKRHQLDVEIVPFDAGWRSIKALREGAVDLAAAADFAKLYQQRFSFDQAFPQYLEDKQSNEIGLSQALLLQIENQAEWLLRDQDNSQIPNYLERVYFEGIETVKPSKITIIR